MRRPAAPRRRRRRRRAVRSTRRGGPPRPRRRRDGLSAHASLWGVGRPPPAAGTPTQVAVLAMRVAGTIGATRAAAASTMLHALRAGPRSAAATRERLRARAGVDHEQRQMREGVGDVTFGGGAAAAGCRRRGGRIRGGEARGERSAQVGGAAEQRRLMGAAGRRCAAQPRNVERCPASSSAVA